MIDVLRLSCTEQWLEHRVGQEARIEGVLQAMQGLFSSSVFVKRRHSVTPSAHRASWTSIEISVGISSKRSSSLVTGSDGALGERRRCLRRESESLPRGLAGRDAQAD